MPVFTGFIKYEGKKKMDNEILKLKSKMKPP